MTDTKLKIPSITNTFMQKSDITDKYYRKKDFNN